MLIKHHRLFWCIHSFDQILRFTGYIKSTAFESCCASYYSYWTQTWFPLFWSGWQNDSYLLKLLWGHICKAQTHSWCSINVDSLHLLLDLLLYWESNEAACAIPIFKVVLIGLVEQIICPKDVRIFFHLFQLDCINLIKRQGTDIQNEIPLGHRQ